MSKIREEAERLANMAIGFNHPMIPAQGRAVIHESARLLHEMAVELEKLKQRVAEYEQAAK